MSELDDDQALERVVERLAERFPTLTPERIRNAVDDEYRRLENAPVRDFVPVLVEHSAMERLRAEAEPVRIAVAEEEQALRVLDDPPELDPMEVERRDREQHSGFLFGDRGGPT